VGDPSREDPDSLVGEAVADSKAIHEALVTLAATLRPSLPLTEQVCDVLARVSALLRLRDDWLTYCTGQFSLDSEATDSTSEMSCLYVAGHRVRAWPRFAEGKAALDDVIEPIVDLQQALASFYGHDITALLRELRAAQQQPGAA
jgi:hypothetical protein